MSAFKSKKLWVAVIGGALVAGNKELGLNFTPEQIYTFAGIIVSYLIGQSYVDAKKNPPA